MNKIYRLVRNTSTGEWAVASELARSRGKSGAAGKAMLVLTTVMAVAGFGAAGSAEAACTGFPGNTVICTGSTTGFLSAGVTGETTVTATNWMHDGGSMYLDVTGGNVTFTGTNVTMTNGGLSPTTNGLVHMASHGAYDASMTIDNSSFHTATTATAQGLSTHADGTGNATTKVTNTTVIMTAGSTGPAVQAVASGGGAGNATVEFYSGSITTTGVAGLNVTGSGTGDANIIESGSIITTSGANAYAVNAMMHNNGAGDISIKTDGTFVTNGDASHGINANSVAGAIVIDTSSAITTNGVNSSGIYASSSAGGDVTVDNSGAIATVGNNSHGIRASTTGAGDIVVGNTDDITTIGNASHGINAVSSAGAISIANSGAIVTSGMGSRGIAAVSTSGDIAIDSSGDITTNYPGTVNDTGSEIGIYANTGGTGNIAINASGALDVNGVHSHGIYAVTNASGSGGDIAITYSGPSVTTRGANGDGIRGDANGTGNVSIVTSGNGTVKTTATTRGSAYGMVAQTQDGRIDIDNTLSIETMSTNSSGIYANSSTGDINVVNSGDITTSGPASMGILAQSVGGDVKVIASGDITTNDTSLALAGNVRSHGIFAATDGAAGKVASIEYTGGSITVNASSDSDYDMVSALRAETSGGADAAVTVTTADSITVNGSNTAGIDVRGVADAVGDPTPTTGNVKVEYLSGTINAGTGGSLNADGIHAVNYGTGNVDVLSLGDINVAGNAETAYGSTWGSEAIYAAAVLDGNAIVTAGGNIQVLGANAGESAGIVAETHGAGKASITFDDAAGGVSTVAEAAPALKAVALGTGDAEVTVTAGKISASGQANAVEVISAQAQAVTVGGAGDLSGGWGSGAAISLQGANTTIATVTNAGTIGALSDRALGTNFVDGATLNIVNQASGAISGYLTLGDGANALDNAGTWNLRNLSDSDGDGVRDTLAVAVSDFGANTGNTINNSGTLNLLGGSAGNVDMSGLFDTGYATNTLASDGAVQGHILGVNRFSNSGVIDMGDANGAVGDVLLISGSRVAGTSGNGTYVSDGGLLKIDTVLNEGGASSQSDILVVDGVELGSGATAINVKNVGGAGALTVDNGIEVVRVLDGDRSQAGAFVLDGRAVASVYEYILQQGSSTDPADGNWYLRNTLEPDPPCDDCTSTPIYRPEPFAYLGNQVAANGMFRHTLHDRLGEPNYAERNRGDDKNTGAWVRVQGHQLDTRTAEQIGADIDTWMVQGGVELGRWSAGGSRFHVGGMVGTGRSTTRVDSEVTGHAAIGRVKGSSLGVYGTWYANAEQPTGLYVDSWLQYGRYDNDVDGDYQAKESYKSSTLAFSLEAGYAFELRSNGRSAIYIEPQVQAIFTDYSSDGFTEASGMEVRDGGDAEVLTRLGARLYGHTTNARHNKVQPFVEANWWHAAQEATMRFDGQELDRMLPRDRYEMKVGAELELGGGWTGWAHLGYQEGKQDYKNLDGLIGIKHLW